MLIRKTNPQGVDAWIDDMQVKLHSALTEFFDGAAVYACYGRSYRNETSDGKQAEVYTGNGEYKDVGPDDRYTAISFFGVADTVDVGEIVQAPVHFVMWLNLDKALTSTGQRADEEIRLKVLEVFGAGTFGSPVESIETGVERVFREYKSTRLKFTDMHPNHLFRVNLNAQYESKLNGCTPLSSF